MALGDRYILLAEGFPVPWNPVTHPSWSQWLSENVRLRTVGYNVLPGNRTLSTVFVGVDLESDPVGPPLLWETILFQESGQDLVLCRWSNHVDAMIGHLIALELETKRGRFRNDDWWRNDAAKAKFQLQPTRRRIVLGKEETSPEAGS